MRSPFDPGARGRASRAWMLAATCALVPALAGCEFRWATDPGSASAAVQRPHEDHADVRPFVEAERHELERALSEVTKALAAEGLDEAKADELHERRLALHVALALLPDLEAALIAHPDLADRLVARLPERRSKGGAAVDPLVRWEPAVDAALARARGDQSTRRRMSVRAGGMANPIRGGGGDDEEFASFLEQSGAARSREAIDRREAEVEMRRAQMESERARMKEILDMLERERDRAEEGKVGSKRDSEPKYKCTPGDPLCGDGDGDWKESEGGGAARHSLPSPPPPPTPLQPLKPVLPSAGGARGAAVVEDTELTEAQNGELTRLLRRAGACVPAGPGGNGVYLKVTLSGGRLKNPEVRSDLGLPVAVESCIVEAVRRVKVGFASDGSSRRFEVAVVRP